jgi:hypothetical protein
MINATKAALRPQPPDPAITFCRNQGYVWGAAPHNVGPPFEALLSADMAQDRHSHPCRVNVA